MKFRQFLLSLSILLITKPIHSSLIIDDFSQVNKTRISAIYYPTTNKERQNIVALAKKLGKKVSVAGKRHSQGGHAFYTDNIVIDIGKFNKILHLDTKNKIITVQTGATWEEIQEFINPHNLAIKVMQTTQIFTVGGSLSVNAHGRDPKFGPLIETIKAVRILLASGEIVEASRTQNYDLFKLAIGGYGLFGIILEADIELTSNPVYAKQTRIIRTKDYPSFIERNLIGKANVGLHFGIVCMAPYDYFNRMLVINYEELPKNKKIPDQAYVLEDEKFVDIVRKGLDLRRQSRLFNFCSEVGEWPFVVAREKLPHVTCRNNAMRHPVKCVEHSATDNTDVLQSYLIPTSAFANFMHYLKKHAKDADLKIMFVLTRYIPKNSESFLHYTPENYFEIVLFINHGTKQHELSHAQAWTQKTIDKVLSYGGKFYLPVRTNASKAQIKKAYPQIDDFFRKKREFDPEELFVNCFYKKYAY